MKRLITIIALVAVSITAFAQSLRPTPDKWANPTGQYPVTMEVYSTLPDYTVYRPTNMEELADKSLPVVIMMGPGCNQDGDSFRPFWSEVASYGYIVIATGRPLPGNFMAPVFYLGVEDIIIALDWAFAAPEASEATLKAKADLSKVCLMGQSCGGIQCLRTAKDPRVSTMIFWNSGSLLMGNVDRPGQHSWGGRDIFGTKDLRELLLDLDIPLAYFEGDTDMARQPGLADFNALTMKKPIIYAVREIPGDSHAGTFREKNGGAFGEVAVAYLEWQFRGDQAAKGKFVGKNNIAAKDPKWLELKTKNIK